MITTSILSIIIALILMLGANAQTAPTPGPPCYFCGNDPAGIMANPTVSVNLTALGVSVPEVTTVPCNLILGALATGSATAEQCVQATTSEAGIQVQIDCGCSVIGTIPPAAAPIPTTLPSVLPSAVPIAIISPTIAPVLATAAPVLATAAPVLATAAPVLATAAPVLTTAAPVLTTAAPVLTTAAPILTTPAPILTTPAPITPSPSPSFVLPTTPAPVIPTTPAPVIQDVPTRAPSARDQEKSSVRVPVKAESRTYSRPVEKPTSKPIRQNKPTRRVMKPVATPVVVRKPIRAPRRSMNDSDNTDTKVGTDGYNNIDPSQITISAYSSINNNAEKEIIDTPNKSALSWLLTALDYTHLHERKEILDQGTSTSN